MAKIIPHATQSDAELDALIEAGKREPNAAIALTATYLADTEQITVTFDNGIEVRFPRSIFRELASITSEQFAKVQITEGVGLSWPEFDADYRLANMLDTLGTSCRVLAEYGRRGGSARSEAKAAAVRANGKKGGRPRTHPLKKAS